MKRIFTLLCLAMSLAYASAQRADNYPPTKNSSVQLTETNLPIVMINVDGKMIQREDRITATIKIIDNGPGKTNYADLKAHPDQKIDYEGYIGLKYRGNSSFTSSDKKPYGFKTMDKAIEDGGKKVKVKLLGLGKDNDWVLLAPFADKSMMRDVLTFELARPYFDWVPSSRHCELLLDGRYYGIYILTERPGKGKTRLNLHDPGEDDGDMTGDWRVEIDRPDEDHYYRSKYHPYGRNGQWDTSRYITYQYDDPEYDDFASLPAGTEKAIQQSINDMEDCFASDSYQDPVNGYSHYIDVTSFIDYMLSTEFTFNVDGYRLSSHMYKYSDTRARKEGLDSRWKTTLWDFNIALGNADYYNGARTDLWQYDLNSRSTDDQLVPFWWKRLLDDPAYQTQLRSRWQQYRSGQYATDRITTKIDSIASLLTSGGAMSRNEAAWGMFGRYVWPNAYVASSYQDEVSYLKQWVAKRLQFMDRRLLPQETLKTTPLSVQTGYTHDVVVEALPSSTHATKGIDYGGSTFYTTAVKAEGGLPADGVITTPSGVTFQLADYTAPNAVVLRSGDEAEVHFATPTATSALYLLSSSGSGSSTLQVTPLYSDDSQGGDASTTVADWSVRNPTGDEAISGLGRLAISTGQLSTECHYCLFESQIDTDPSRTLSGLRIASTKGGQAAILAFACQQSAATAIDDVTTRPTQVSAYYTPSGIRLSKPQKGINIVRYADGTSKKIVVAQ